MRTRPTLIAGVILLSLGAALPARAQQVTSQPAAAQPSKGVTLARQKVRWYRLDDERAASARSIDELSIETILAHGLTADFTVMLHLPLIYRDTDSSVLVALIESLADLLETQPSVRRALESTANHAKSQDVREAAQKALNPMKPNRQRP